MFKTFLRWLMKFHYRRKIQQVISEYLEISKSRDRSLYVGSFFIKQEELLESGAFDGLFINALPSSSVYIYYDLETTIKKFEEFAFSLERNAVINGNLLGEFQQNSSSQVLQKVFNEDEDIKTQLLKISKVLNRILTAYGKQTNSIKQVNLSRIIIFFEMYSIIFHRIAEGYIDL